MKKIIINILVMVLMCALCLVFGKEPPEAAHNNSTLYAQATIVREIDEAGDIVTVEDYNGNLWQFEGVEDWTVGDNANLLMNDNGTSTIYDDTIERVTYGAWTLTR